MFTLKVFGELLKQEILVPFWKPFFSLKFLLITLSRPNSLKSLIINLPIHSIYTKKQKLKNHWGLRLFTCMLIKLFNQLVLSYKMSTFHNKPKIADDPTLSRTMSTFHKIVMHCPSLFYSCLLRIWKRLNDLGGWERQLPWGYRGTSQQS